MKALFLIALLIFPKPLWAAVTWPLQELYQPPKTFPAPSKSEFPQVKSVFLEGLPWQGKKTRVYCYYGLPRNASAKNKVPAMVLIHGGGGSAFADWVKLWNERGYAAIAMDTCGNVSGLGYNNHSRHDFAGPEGWGGFDQTNLAVKDQWTYHAVAAVIKAHSFLRSMPEVDVERVGLTGVSWGGYLSCIVAGVDQRFQFAAPIYGCGFLSENSCWLPNFEKLGPEKTKEWTANWDPKNYLPQAKIPFLWITGTNDFAYPLDSLKKSALSLPKPAQLSIPGDMPHGQPEGQSPKALAAYAEHHLKNGPPLPVLKTLSTTNETLVVAYQAEHEATKASLLYTTDSGSWKERQWQSSPANINTAQGQISATFPPKTTACLLNFHDARGFVISSQIHLP